MRSVVLVVALVAAAWLTACATAGHARDTEHDDPAVRAAIATAWRVHIDAAIEDDLDAVLEIYADDVVYAIDDAPEVRGLEALRESERASLEGADVLYANHRTLGLAVFGDVAHEIGVVVGDVQPVGGEPAEVTCHFSAVWRRGGDGVWRMARFAGGT